MKRSNMRMLWPVLALFAVPAAGFAADAVKISDACKTEISTLCPVATPEGGGIGKCLHDNEAKLGADCSGAMKVAKERRAAMKSACAADANTFCKDEAGKGGHLVKCLKAKASEISKPCADTIAAMTAVWPAQAMGTSVAPAAK